MQKAWKKRNFWAFWGALHHKAKKKYVYIFDNHNILP
jgi:hypothetical protein